MSNLFLPVTDLETLNLCLSISELLNNNQIQSIFSNCKVKAFYGSPPGSLWSGGRNLPYKEIVSIAQLSKYITYLNNLNIQCRITFTNSLLQKEHLMDEYCNNILDVIDNGFNNAIITASSILDDYIITTHPNLSLISSITKGNDLQTFQQNFANQIYDMVVTFPKNNILNYIQTLPKEQLNRVEILINSNCGNCPFSKQHYDSISKNILLNYDKNFDCVWQNNDDYIKYKNALSIDEHIFVNIDYFEQMGLENFKIAGRGSNVEELFDELYYKIFPNQSKDYIKELINVYQINTF